MTGVVRLVALRPLVGLQAATLCVATLCGAIAAASPVFECPSSTERGGRLVVGTRSEAKHFNPLTAVDQPTKTVLSLLHADLLRIDRANQEVSPSLASTWNVSDDGRTHTLTLREGVRFSDGHPLSVDDVVFSFGAYLDERVSSPQRDLLFVGGEPIRVEKLDERRVAFELAEPYAAGERLFDSFHVLPQHLLEAADDRGELASVWGLLTEPARMAGLGPFRVKEVIAGDRIVLERNPHYWKVDASRTALPYLDEVVFQLIPSPEALVLRFKAGDVHVIERVNPDDFDALAADPSSFSMLDLGPGLEFHFFFFNLNDTTDQDQNRRKGWFENVAFRRAISTAIDKQAVVDLVYRGRASTLATHVTPGDARWLNRELRVAPYSESEAKEQLASAGFRWDADTRLVDEHGIHVEFSILTNAGNRNRAMMASLIQEDMERVGITVNIVSLEFRAYVDRIFQTRDYDGALMALVSGDADPNPQLSVLMSDGGTHVWHLGQQTPATPWEAEIDRLMQRQLVTLDHARRKALYDRVQRVVFENQPFIALASPHVLVGAAARLENFRPGIVPPYTLWNADELFFSCPSEVKTAN